MVNFSSSCGMVEGYVGAGNKTKKQQNRWIKNCLRSDNLIICNIDMSFDKHC